MSCKIAEHVRRWGSSAFTCGYDSALGGGADGRFEEVDEFHSSSTRCRCGEATQHGTDRKIDYIFVSARDFYDVDGDATSSSLSDHDPLRGSATLDHTP